MKLPKIKDLVGKDKKVYFSFYREGELWYKTQWFDGDVYTGQMKDFEFPIPSEDMKGGTFNAEDKSIFHMRFIRKHLESLHEALAKEGVKVE